MVSISLVGVSFVTADAQTAADHIVLLGAAALASTEGISMGRLLTGG